MPDYFVIVIPKQRNIWLKDMHILMFFAYIVTFFSRKIMPIFTHTNLPLSILSFLQKK